MTAWEGGRAMVDAGPARDQGFVEALTPGVDGWLDELLAVTGDWAGIDLVAVTASAA